MHPILAQAVESVMPLYRAFAELGFAGAMLYWLTMRMEKKMDLFATRMHENTWSNTMMAKTQLITLIALGQLDNPVRIQAEGVLQEILKKEEARKSPVGSE